MRETLEVGHMGHPDFRVGARDLRQPGHPDERWAMVKLTPEQQEAFVAADPVAFAPVKGGWGKGGATQRAPAQGQGRQRSAAALMAAWRNVAPTRLAEPIDWPLKHGNVRLRRMAGCAGHRRMHRGRRRTTGDRP